jgi:hypothetical protein
MSCLAVLAVAAIGYLLLGPFGAIIGLLALVALKS